MTMISKQKRSQSNLKLHLGCGKHYLKGYTHIDLADYSHIDYKHDIKTLPMIKNNSVDVIYASHVIDYFDRVEIIDILKEWKRVLVKGGTLRLAVPDFEKLVEIYYLQRNYKNGDIFPLTGTDILFGRWEIKNHGIIYHKMAYDIRTLSELLTNCGFRNPRRWDWQEVFVNEYAGYDDYSQSYIPHMNKEEGLLISLNVEATK